MERSRRWSVATGAIGVVLLFLFSAAMGAFGSMSATPSNAGASAAPAPSTVGGGLPYLGPNAPASLRALHSGTPLTAAETATVEQVRATLSSGAQTPTAAEEYAALQEVYPAAAANATPSELTVGLTPATCSSYNCAFLSLLTANLWLSGTCIVLTGLFCLGIIAGLAFGSWITGLFGGVFANAAQEAAQTAATLGLQAYEEAAWTLAGSEKQIVSLVNETQNEMGYAASSAALEQIGNYTWNGPLDLYQSGIAANLSFVASGFIGQEAAMLAQLVEDWGTTLGSADSSGYGCELLVGNSGNALGGNDTITAGSLTSSCGGTTGGGGEVYGTTTQAYWYEPVAGDWVYLPKGSPLWGEQRTVSAPITFHSPLSNVSFTVGPWDKNLSVPAGGLWTVTAAGTYSGLFCQVCFAMNGATVAHFKAAGLDAIAQVFQANHSPYGSLTAGQATILGDASIRIQPNGENNYCAAFGDLKDIAWNTKAVCPADNWFGLSTVLIQTEAFAVTSGAIGQSYWMYLHLLGYYSLSAIPTKCIIPSPVVALEGVPAPELTGANYSWILGLYSTYLHDLGYDFNSTAFVLNTQTFCNHPEPRINSTGQMNTYGYGYLFINGTHVRNANGTANQSFANPATWNVSGEIYIQPALYNMSVPENTSWLFSELQPAWAYVVPFVNNTTGRVIANAPSTCALTGKCATYSQAAFFVPLLYGNSTAKGGGALSTRAVGSFGADAAFLTVCYHNPDIFNTTQTWRIASSCAFAGGLNISQTPIINKTGGGGGLTSGAGTCGGAVWSPWATFINDISSAVGSIPILGAFSCAVAWALGVIVAIILLIVVIFAAMAIGRYALSRNRTRTASRGPTVSSPRQTYRRQPPRRRNS